MQLQLQLYCNLSSRLPNQLAAQALRESNERRASSFSEATKVVQCPKEFGSSTSAEDQSACSDFAFCFKQWLFFADPLFEPDFKHIEDSPGAAVTFLENPAGLATKERSRKLYLILGGILKNRPLKILRQVQQQNGLEAWRQLSALYVPRTKGRSLALLNAVMQFSSHEQGQNHVGADSSFGEGVR